MSTTGQERLANAKVLMLGFGGSACACATYLAAAGIGSLVLVDESLVYEDDLCDEPLFEIGDVGRPKVEVAKKQLLELNAELSITALRQPIDSHNAEDLLASADIVLDGLLDWQDKLLISDICMQMGKTLVHAGVRGFEFQIYTMIPGKSACLRCAFAKAGLEDVSAEPDHEGALGPVSGMAGSFQAIETIKILAGIGPTPGSHLIKFDSLRRDFDDVTDLGPRPDCPDCGMRF